MNWILDETFSVYVRIFPAKMIKKRSMLIPCPVHRFIEVFFHHQQNNQLYFDASIKYFCVKGFAAV